MGGTLVHDVVHLRFVRKREISQVRGVKVCMFRNKMRVGKNVAVLMCGLIPVTMILSRTGGYNSIRPGQYDLLKPVFLAVIRHQGVDRIAPDIERLDLGVHVVVDIGLIGVGNRSAAVLRIIRRFMRVVVVAHFCLDIY